MSSGAAGVGRTPPSRTSAPAAVAPAAMPASSMGPDSRVSRMPRTWGGPPEPSAAARRTAAAARPSASWAVTFSPATPRTPSVPKSRRAKRLPLGELRPLAGLLEAGLLALLLARVAREEAAALELAAQVGVGLDERAGDAVAQRAGLGGRAAAVQRGHDVHARLVAHGLQRLADVALQGGTREVGVQLAAVDRVRAAAGSQDDARDGGLALAGGAVARVGAEVDGRLGDRPVLDGGVVGAVGPPGLAVLAVLALGERVVALG